MLDQEPIATGSTTPLSEAAFLSDVPLSLSKKETEKVISEFTTSAVMDIVRELNELIGSEIDELKEGLVIKTSIKTAQPNCAVAIISINKEDELPTGLRKSLSPLLGKPLKRLGLINVYMPFKDKEAQPGSQPNLPEVAIPIQVDTGAFANLAIKDPILFPLKDAWVNSGKKQLQHEVTSTSSGIENLSQ